LRRNNGRARHDARLLSKSENPLTRASRENRRADRTVYLCPDTSSGQAEALAWGEVGGGAGERALKREAIRKSCRNWGDLLITQERRIPDFIQHSGIPAADEEDHCKYK